MHAPGWHKLGHVLDEYPGREKGEILAGHNFTVVERDFFMPSTRPVAAAFKSLDHEGALLGKHGMLHVTEDGVFSTAQVPGFKALVKSMPDEVRPTWLDTNAPWTPTDGMIFAVPRDSYGVVQNSVGWDILEALLGEGKLNIETALALRGGAMCSILAYLAEPYTVPGDNSPTLPYLNLSWAHDGTAAFKCRPTSVRVVCMNTQGAAEMQGIANKNEYTFRHTSNVMERIEDAKNALKGLHQDHEEFKKLANELADIKITKRQRKIFVEQFIPMPISDTMISDNQKVKIEDARKLVTAILDGETKRKDGQQVETVPEAHRFTAYGLHLAGVEYLDHYRGQRKSQETVFTRQVLRDEPFKGKLGKLIHEVATA